MLVTCKEERKYDSHFTLFSALQRCEEGEDKGFLDELTESGRELKDTQDSMSVFCGQNHNSLQL